MYRTKHFKFKNADELVSLLYSVFNTSHDGLFVCDKEGNALMYNDALLRITGLSHEFINNYHVFEGVRTKAVPVSGAVLAIQTKQTATVIIDYQGGKKAIVTATPHLDENGEILFVVSNLRDITEINRLQQELESSRQSNEMYEKTLKQLQRDLGLHKQPLYRSAAMQKIVTLAERMATNNLPVLLLGESGVGKDVLAHYIHEKSNRKGPLVKINCGAIPESLLESELFGYEKGAFTGASGAKEGLFEAAHTGTIFLDEIGDLPFPMQVKLLNVLQDYKVRRIGGNTAKDIDVRVIAATNSDLEQLVEQKKFRLDLYYRLNVLTITIPPLRERKEDIPALAMHFLGMMKRQYGWEKRLDNAVLRQMMEYAWPGNVRELKNAIERLYLMSEEETITLQDFQDIAGRRKMTVLPDRASVADHPPRRLKDAVAAFENKYIASALKQCSSLQECADLLGISLSTLVRKKRALKTLAPL